MSLTPTLDVSSFSAALKQHYVDLTIANMVYADNPLLALMPKDEKFGGANLPLPLLYGNPQGRSASFVSAQANKNASKTVQFLLTRISDYATANIKNEVIEASMGDSDAFMRAATTEIDGAFQAITRSLAIAMYRNGTGSIGQISSGSNVATASITLSNIEEITNFEVGMTVQLSATDGAAPRAGSLEISGIDRQLGTITFTGNVTAGVAAAAVNDYILVNGDSNGKLSGLDAWIPLANPSATTFFGVDRTKDYTRLSGVRRDVSDRPIEEGLIDVAAAVGREGGKSDLCAMNFENFASLEKALGSKVQYAEVKSEVGIGFSAIKVQGPKGTINVLADQNCQGDRFHMLQKSTWKMYSLGKAPKLLRSDGNDFLRVSNDDAVEVRVGYYAQMGCQAPGWNGVGKLR
jgi:hypothetical protein